MAGVGVSAPQQAEAARAASGAVLAVSSLVVTFGGIRAVDDVSFSVRPGQILGLIGPNGAGKTTVLDAICGFVPSRGRIVMGGLDISTLPPHGRARARLGRSFQDAKLFPSLTVYETLCVGCERHIRTEGVVSTALFLPWVRRAERRVAKRAEELIELMGLGAFHDKFISELSTGSRRIVDLAVILAHDPLVLLLDEPSSGIAQRETEALAPLLRRIRDETGAAMLVIEHDMPLISSVSDEILALELGTVICQGLPAEVLADPRLISAYLGTNRAVVQRSGRVEQPGPNGAEHLAAPVSSDPPAERPEAPRRRTTEGSNSARKTAPSAKPKARRRSPNEP
jgi:branched-chain amino acid transport system ATP-binding protein